MDIAALSMVLNQGKVQQQASLSVMKMAMGVASDQSNSIAAIQSFAVIRTNTLRSKS